MCGEFLFVNLLLWERVLCDEIMEASFRVVWEGSVLELIFIGGKKDGLDVGLSWVEIGGREFGKRLERFWRILENFMVVGDRLLMWRNWNYGCADYNLN